MSCHFKNVLGHVQIQIKKSHFQLCTKNDLMKTKVSYSICLKTLLKIFFFNFQGRFLVSI